MRVVHRDVGNVLFYVNSPHNLQISDCVQNDEIVELALDFELYFKLFTRWQSMLMVL